MQQEIRVSDPRSEAMLNAYHQVVVERLEQGLEDIQASSLEAMREIAIEIWRTSGAQGEDIQKRLLAAISKDESLRGVMELADERFQSLSLRVSQIDDSMLAMSNATRELRSLIVSGAWGSDRPSEKSADSQALEATAVQLGARIDEIEHHLAAAFQNLAQRDTQLLAAVQEKVAKGAGQGGAAARTADLEDKLAASAGAMSTLVESVRQEVAQLNVLATRENDTDPAQISATLDDRLSRLAGLVRSDSRAIAELVQSQSEAQARALAETLDQRLGRMSEIVSATTMAAVNEVARSVPEQAAEALSKRVDEVVAAIDKNFIDLVDVTETEMHRVGRLIADRTAAQTATQVDTAIAGRLDGTVARLTNAAEVMERSSATGGSGAPAGLPEATGEGLAAIVDARVTALAKMIRSDNKAMAQVMQVAAEQQAAKQAARVAMEMAASLPQQIMETLDRRFAEFAENMHAETQSTVVAVAKAADVLAQRMDQTASAVNAKNEQDLAAMNDRFGRAVHEIATRIQ